MYLPDKPLPDKPSDLIDLALDDLEKCENSPEYRVDMGFWHYPISEDQGESSVCLVCLAGAVMAQTLKANPLCAHEVSVGGSRDRGLAALDDFRTGDIHAAFTSLQRGPAPLENRLIETYEDSPERFKSDMRQLAADLRGVGY